MHASDRGLGPWAYPPSPLETPLSPLGTTSGLTCVCVPTLFSPRSRLEVSIYRSDSSSPGRACECSRGTR